MLSGWAKASMGSVIGRGGRVILHGGWRSAGAAPVTDGLGQSTAKPETGPRSYLRSTCQVRHASAPPILDAGSRSDPWPRAYVQRPRGHAGPTRGHANPRADPANPEGARPSHRAGPRRRPTRRSGGAATRRCAGDRGTGSAGGPCGRRAARSLTSDRAPCSLTNTHSGTAPRPRASASSAR